MSTTRQINRPLKGLKVLNQMNAAKAVTADTDSVIELPRDMYLHTPIWTKENPSGCPTEWWWHTGSLKADDGRVFGFEINAAAFYPAYVTEVMLTDVQNKKHYQQSSKTLIPFEGWAESDPNKDWKVDLLNVQMHAPKNKPTQNMSVHATLTDGNASVKFDLTMNQDGKPFLVWGTGVSPKPTPPTTATNNYYFSLTRLHVTGTITITIDDVIEEINVTGVTWMDHEWGLFKEDGHSVKWILQDMQLENGVTISNSSFKPPVIGSQITGIATIQAGPNQDTVCVESKLTPKKRWQGPDGHYYVTESEVLIPSYGAKFTVKSLMDDQLFTGVGAPIYEGAGTVSGSMKIGAEIVDVNGTAWVEQTS